MSAATWVALAVASGYALLRYCVFGDVSFRHAPLFVLNKAVAWAALTLLVVGLAGARWPPRFGRWPRSSLVRRAVALGRAHVVASLVLVGPAYYPTLYDPDGRMNVAGELLIASGVFAVAYPILKSPWARVAIVATLALHAGALAAATGYAPEQWPGGMPPISWWSLLVALIGLALTVRHVLRDGASPAS
ncbi:MAG: hypothetical protein IV100_30605 [Myxococcales bacterium]|nr:hypothetical protein [Myxococcales bacterium]